MKQSYLKEKNLPDKPGIYMFLDSHKEILYIGKATSLRDRVKSYFSKDLIETRGPLIVDMVFKAKDISHIETDSVLEALILEANLIKKHQPKYNTKEKDNKSFNYVCITKGDIPLVVVERGRHIDFENKQTTTHKFQAIFGPFANGGALREALKIVRKIFPYIDPASAKKHNTEFYRQLGLAPDTQKEGMKKEYQKTIKNLMYFFDGKKDKVIKNLEKEMKSFAKVQEFEKADMCKRRIFGLQHIRDVALIKEDDLYEKGDSKGRTDFRIEAYDVAHIQGSEMVGVMTVVTNNEVDKKEYRKFKIKTVRGANDTASLEEILTRRLGHATWQLPNLIVLDGGIAQYNTAERVLREKGFNIDFVSVVKDERHKPKDFLGQKSLILKHKKSILLANSEAHRFAITYHRMLRSKRIRA